jgi:hypothetical protein
MAIPGSKIVDRILKGFQRGKRLKVSRARRASRLRSDADRRVSLGMADDYEEMALSSWVHHRSNIPLSEAVKATSGRNAIAKNLAKEVDGLKVGHDLGLSRGMTISDQLVGAVGIGLTGATINAGISSFQDTFGHQMSGLGNFALSAAKVGVGVVSGVKMATSIGRAGILANAKYSSKSAAAKAVASLEAKASLGTGIGSQRAKLKTWARSRTPSSPGTTRAMSGDNVPGGVVYGTMPASTKKAFLKTSKRDRLSIKEMAKQQRRITSNKKMLRQSYGMRDAQKFSVLGGMPKWTGGAGGLASTVVGLPFMLAGGLIGRGSLWGKGDDLMKFMGPSMAGGFLAGAGAGAAAGISSVKRGNLKNVSSPAPRVRGRSFGNLNYNATLHAHRLNM